MLLNIVFESLLHKKPSHFQRGFKAKSTIDTYLKFSMELFFVVDLPILSSLG